MRINCYPKGYAAPGVVRCQCNMRESPSKLKRMSPHRKIVVTSKSPVGDISVVTLIRTDTTLDHSPKAEKVCQGCGGVSGKPINSYEECWSFFPVFQSLGSCGVRCARPALPLLLTPFPHAGARILAVSSWNPKVPQKLMKSH